MFQGLQGGMGAISVLGGGTTGGITSTSPAMSMLGGGDKKRKKPISKVVPYDMASEMRKSGRTPMVYDNGGLPTDIAKRVATKAGVKPSLLFSSAWQEGMNKAALSPDLVSKSYNDNESKLGDYPVDGFFNYGLDTIGDRYDKIKKYLPEGFEQKLKFYKATNEKNQPITTAAFKTNEDALTAKAAFMKYEMDNVNDYATKKGIALDDKAKDYFMLASYNGGLGNAQKMIDEYASATDKDKFIDEGQTRLKEVHKNIKTRLDNMKVADELFNQK